MKRSFKLFFKSLLFISIIFTYACSKTNNNALSEVIIDPNIKGGVPDTIIFNYLEDSSVALKNILEADSDLFLDNLSPLVLNTLNSKTKEKLDIYTLPSNNLAFVLNPFPNKAPYQTKLDNITEFNPFAIKEIRYALNFLINRKYIVENIMNNNGFSSFSPIAPGTLNFWRFEIQSKKTGLTPEGDKNKALKDINLAMESASKLPDNQNKLIKKNGTWYFLNKPITIKLIIKTNDSQERKNIINYVSGLIEESGIKTEKLLWDEIYINQKIYGENPSKLSWSLYSENISPSSSNPWLDQPIIKDMTSLWGNQPGWGNTDFWNYKNSEADKIANNIISGKIENVDEYWSNLLKINEIGTKDAIRIFVATEFNTQIANKVNFKEKMFYETNNGLSRISLENANMNNGTLKVLETYNSDEIYSSSWNPIGLKGFNDKRSFNLVQMLFDDSLVIGPLGQISEKRTSVVSTKVDPKFERDTDGNISKVSGTIPIDENSLVWSKLTNQYKKVGVGFTAPIETTFRINFGTWQSGREIKKSDYIYVDDFINNWASKSNPNDLEFDSNYALYWAEKLESKLGTKWNSDGTVTIWSNNFSPKGNLYNIGIIPSLKVSGNENSSCTVPWEILEAIQDIILNGSKSGTKYGFSKSHSTQEIDLKSNSFLTDLKAKLSDFIENKHIPTSLKYTIKVDEAISNYTLTLAFINKYGHALIGNGPYILTKIDEKGKTAQLDAFRNKAYTEEKNKWTKLYKTSNFKIEQVAIPASISSGENIEIKIEGTELLYPYDISIKAVNGYVYGLLINNNSETRFEGINLGNGSFTIPIDPETSKSFKGSYTLVIFGTIDGKFTDTKIRELIFK